MPDELLSEIMAAEREIRRQLSALEKERTARLAAARAEAAETLRQEAARLEAQFDRALETVTQEAEQESLAVVAGANAYAGMLSSLEADRLDRIIARHLHVLRLEDAHDRQDEQA